MDTDGERGGQAGKYCFRLRLRGDGYGEGSLSPAIGENAQNLVHRQGLVEDRNVVNGPVKTTGAIIIVGAIISNQSGAVEGLRDMRIGMHGRAQAVGGDHKERGVVSRDLQDHQGPLADWRRQAGVPSSCVGIIIVPRIAQNGVPARRKARVVQAGDGRTAAAKDQSGMVVLRTEGWIDPGGDGHIDGIDIPGGNGHVLIGRRGNRHRRVIGGETRHPIEAIADVHPVRPIVCPDIIKGRGSAAGRVGHLVELIKGNRTLADGVAFDRFAALGDEPQSGHTARSCAIAIGYHDEVITSVAVGCRVNGQGGIG